MAGRDGQCYVECCDGSVLLLLTAATTAGPVDLHALAQELARQPLVLS
jgi:hypothetical protein